MGYRYCRGQRVECIRRHDEPVFEDLNVPEVDELYFVRAIDPAGGLLLREIVNDPVGAKEPSFPPDRFRPLADFTEVDRVH